MSNQRIVVVDVNRIPSILLQTFLTVAEAGQISEAARRLHLSQPTVTGHIRSWEIQQEIAMGLVRQINIPGLRIQRMLSWALRTSRPSISARAAQRRAWRTPW